jgi:hypothetical protein
MAEDMYGRGALVGVELVGGLNAIEPRGTHSP